MNKREAMRLELRVQKDDPQITTELQFHGRGDWSIGITDHRTGYSAVVESRQGWADRVAAATELEF